MKTDKVELRNKYKSVRSENNSYIADATIYHAFVEHVKLLNIDTLFLYYAKDTEISTIEFIRYALEKGIKVALPKCSNRDGAMDFYIISDFDTQLVEGMFSIMEPDTEKCVKATDTVNSICIVPGLSFDKRGYRLGYGKGYYDRFLSKFKGKSIGLCYNACLCDELPFDKYDRKVDTIITEKEIISLR